MMQNISVVKPEPVTLRSVEAGEGTFVAEPGYFSGSVNTGGSINSLAVTVTFEKPGAVNLVDIVPESENFNFLLNVFYSEDSVTWQRAAVSTRNKKGSSWRYELPLIFASSIMLVFYKEDNASFSEFKIKKCELSHESAVVLASSSNSDRLWTAENLIDKREEYGWRSEPYEKNSTEFIEIDLGRLYHLNRFALRAVKENPNCFPPAFQVFVSADKARSDSIISEEQFFVAPGAWYSWDFNIVRVRYITIQINQLFRKRKNEFLTQILELNIFAVPENKVKVSEKNNYILASELVPGVVTFAENNTAVPNKAVQANDARLKKATVEYPGIVQLARDGHETEKTVVQANDRRLKTASEELPGIVQLAKDAEQAADKVVKSNDSRLQKGSEEAYGIIRFAKNNEYSSLTALQASDQRIKPATEDQAGILRLAKNNENIAGAAVQGNDNRLREATTQWPGILKFSNHNEDEPLKAVQADDPRLKEGSEQIKGRVQFARHGEVSPMKALQSDDSRLQPATTSDPGIMKFASHNDILAKTAVQADDPRLSDARRPLEHQHDYAAKEHELNSHQGTLNIRTEKDIPKAGSFYFTAMNDLPLSSENSAGYSAGFKGGIISTANESEAVTAISDKGRALDARSREDYAATFISEKKYALHLPEKLAEIHGSGKSLLAEGKVKLKGGADIVGDLYMAISYSRYSSEVFLDGDMLTVSKNGEIEKVKNSDQPVIGIFVSNSTFKLSEKKSSDKKSILVAVAGIAPVRVRGAVKASEKIVYNGGDAGVGVVTASMNASPVAIALETSDKDKEKTVWCKLV